MSTIASELERLDKAIDQLEQALVDRDQRWHAAVEKAKGLAAEERARTDNVAQRVDRMVERLETVLQQTG
jgi:hypothetical protein